MGDWSPICYHCEWIGGASEPKRGARFRGRNRQGLARWTTTCEVTESEPGRVFEFRVIDGTFAVGYRGREMTRWRYEFSPDASGTKVTESYHLVSFPWLLRPLAPVLRRQAPQREAGMRTTLERLKAAAEG
jgi:polyketide cyclase/dehydrase/lipid transport protein